MTATDPQAEVGVFLILALCEMPLSTQLGRLAFGYIDVAGVVFIQPVK
jgi:hypothetical protein